MPWFDSLLHPSLATVGAYHPARSAWPDAVRLDANESPWPLSEGARLRLAEVLARVELHRYPDVRAAELRRTLAAWLAVEPEQLVLGNGSDEAIALTFHALSRGREGRKPVLLVPAPTFVMYAITAQLSGFEVVSVPLDERWQLDTPAMLAAIERHEPNVVALASPNNPTAACFARESLERVAEATKGRSLLLLDEAYGAFAGQDYADLMARFEHVGRLGTLSKVGLAALRVGWAVLPRALADAVDRVRQPFNLDALSQAAAVLCLTELRGEFEGAVARVRSEREKLARELAEVPGCTVNPSDSNFLWLHLPYAGDLHRALAERGVLVRSFASAGGRMAPMLRVTVGTPAENARLLEALRALLPR